MLLVDDRGMTEANRACFDRSGPTDVISLVYPPFPPGAQAWRGEILVNAHRALEEGRRRGSVARELALYIAHGCDHLGGGEDGTPEGRTRMRRRENRWLRSPDIAPLVESLGEGMVRDA